MSEIQINKAVMEKIADILMEGEEEPVEIYYNAAGTNVYFSTDSQANTLYIRKNNKEYAITNITLINQRRGTFTKILKELKDLAKRENRDLILENVITEEMYNFCYKNNIKKIDNEMSMLMLDDFMGSYIVKY